ncbi:hypothetical protein Bbelb_127220 [Branchiostoma belcheri]|nr:hypothetical protein Bbelb_127220 [Branchiostoma belcheri]
MGELLHRGPGIRQETQAGTGSMGTPPGVSSPGVLTSITACQSSRTSFNATNAAWAWDKLPKTALTSLRAGQTDNRSTRHVVMMAAFCTALILTAVHYTTGVTVSPGSYTTVTGFVGETVILPASHGQNYTVFAETWNKMIGGVHGVRQAVFMFSPVTNTTMSLGPLKGRAELGTRGSLKVTDVRREDEGLYVLTSLLDVIGQEEYYVILRVLSRPGVKIDSKKTVVAVEGSNVVLNCSVNDSSTLIHPPSWKQDGHKVRGSHVVTGNVIRGKGYVSRLVLYAVKRNQGGNYTCQALHRHGREQWRKEIESVVILVLLKTQAGGPLTHRRLNPGRVINVTNVSTDRNTVALRCLAEGKPAPSLAWYRSGFPQAIRSHQGAEKIEQLVLTIPKFHRNQSGEYSCVAGNGIGGPHSTAVYVSFVPRQQMRKPTPGKNRQGSVLVWENQLLRVIVFSGIAASSACLLLVILLTALVLYRGRQRTRAERDSTDPQAASEAPKMPTETNPDDCKRPDVWHTPSIKSIPATMCRKVCWEGGHPLRVRTARISILKVNDTVQVLKASSSGWFYGTSDGKMGAFPGPVWTSPTVATVTARPVTTGRPQKLRSSNKENIDTHHSSPDTEKEYFVIPLQRQSSEMSEEKACNCLECRGSGCCDEDKREAAKLRERNHVPD